MLLGTQQAASQRSVCPVIRTPVARWQLRHQFILCSSFSGIQRVGANCIPEVSSLKMLQPPLPIPMAQLKHVPAPGSAQCATASPTWASNTALFHWNCTFPLRKIQFGSRCSRWSVEIISLLCGSKPTSSLCHYLHLQTSGFARKLTSGDAILVPVIKIQNFNLQILLLYLGYRGQYAWTKTISIIYLLKD